MAGKRKIPGSRKKLSRLHMVEITDAETGQATLRIHPGERRNVVYVEHLQPHVRSRVVLRKP